MILRSFAAILLVLLTALPLQAQDPLPGVPTPLSHFGFEPGTDRKLANWTELTAYYEKLANTSPRVTVDTLGLTTLGEPFVMLTVTSPENHARLDELHAIQMKLSDPRTVRDSAELERLLDEGRTVVLITQQIHSTEVGAGQMAPNLLYRLAASNEDKVHEILDNVILLHVPSLNPDGTQMVSNWYRKWVGTPFEAAPLPSLYHYYIGHDNNRDWYAFTQLETQMAIEGAHNVWHPQIIHDVHQMGSEGARIFVPPFIDPVEPNVDPLIVAGINQLGSYMAAEMISQGKTGVVLNAQYDMFTPARAYQHYHGGVRILSETASADLATPIVIDPDDLGPGRGFDASKRSWNFPAPWEGGEWGLPDIVEYMESGAMALLSNAARNRRYWLDNFYSINERAVAGWESWPEAWVLPADQENAAGLNSVLRILTMGDVEVHRAESAFTAGG
ncbi:MAG TPA: M14 metallopeptidase family protein, partial [Longimicrobiaceae bacterium]|nr:M14 metallopeptidase family protein [Longimicrobiaceae bacterium]